MGEISFGLLCLRSRILGPLWIVIKWMPILLCVQCVCQVFWLMPYF